MLDALREKKTKLLEAYRQFLGVRDEVKKLALVANRALAMATDTKVTQRAINNEIGERLRRLEKCIVLIAKEVDNEQR